MEQNVVISIKNLYKSYITKDVEKIIFEDFSLDINKKDRIGILGKNGVGKTTLANMIIGKTPYKKGEIVFNETNLDKLRDIGYLPQEFQFPLFFTVKDILKVVKKDLKRNKILDENYMQAIMDGIEVTPLLNKRYLRLSGGEKQKINLICVLFYKPKILILDEFTSSIDIETSFKIIKVFDSIKATLIVISHNPKEISELCNRLIFLKNGKIFEEIKKGKKITETKIKNIFQKMESF